MKTISNLSLLLAVALGASACVSEVGDEGGGSGGGGEGGGEGGGGETAATDATGSYAMRSKFDLATNMPGKVGDAVNAIIAATDGADDPANWLLEQVAAQLPSGTIKNLVDGSRPYIAGYLNDQLLSYAPDFVATMVQLGNDFGDMAKNFGTVESLKIGGSDGAYTAVHTVTGAHFKIDNMETDLAFADYQMANVVVQGVGITLSSSGQLGIGAHTVPLSYGKILHIGLDEVLLPMVDSTVGDLGELMQGMVDCDVVGQLIADQIGGYGATTLAAACDAGLLAGAGYIYSQIDAIDGSALEFGLSGTAKAFDKTGDGKIDTIQAGTWTGDLSYAGTPAPLGAATFFGSRK